MVSLNSLVKLVSINNFSESVVLILHYQLPFFQSGRFSGKMNGTGTQLDLFLRVYPVYFKFETYLKIEVRTGTLAQRLFMEY